MEPNISSSARQFYRLKAAPSLPPSLVSWWRGDSNYLDSIGPRNGIPSSNAPGFTAGIRTPAFNFGGTNGLSINSAELPAPWTLSFWVVYLNYSRFPEPIQTLLSDTNSSLCLDVDGYGDIGVSMPSGTNYFYANRSSGWWPLYGPTQLTFVSDSTNLWLWVNGWLQLGPITGNFSLPLSVIGAGSDGVSNGLNGVLDEVMLFDRVLTPTEISQVVNATRGP
jgi:hypothetical protein